jgi:predicted AlkP superfamily phosphohydrolase/phosphomutase
MGLFDRIRGGDGPQVAFVGIDGVPFSLLSEHPDEFENFAAIADAGTGGSMESIVPPESSACWPALTTGVNPGETGVYGFQDRETDSYDTYVPMGRDVQATRLWNRVQEAGQEATVMNVPVTFPPERSIQRMASGFLSPGLDRAAYPDEFREYLEGIGYRIDVNAKLGHESDKSDFLDDAYETLEARHEAFLRYIEADDWNLFFGVYMTTDRINHFLFEEYEKDREYREEFLEFYRTVDRYIGELREALDDDATLVVASDHGFTTLEHEFDCNEWLREEGWLSLPDDAEGLGDIDDDSRAYSLVPGRFYLHLEDREPRGSVPVEAYDETRDELAAAIEEIEGPDGDPVVDRVVTREQAFDGEHTDIAPDLVAIPADGFDLKAGFEGGELYKKGQRNGMHTFDNACLYIDDPDATTEDADLYDVAPTILELLELEYDPAAFDGASLV